MKHGKLAAAVLALATFSSSVAPAAAPTLSYAVERAKTASPTAVTADADVRIASATRAAAPLPSVLNPTLEVLVDRGKYTKDAQVIAQLYVPIEVSGQRGARIGEADALLRWREADRRRVVADAVGEAVAAFGELSISAARLRDARDGEKSAGDEAAYFRARLAAKDATSVDVALAEGELARWEQLRAEADLALARAQVRLAIVIGLPSVDAPDGSDVGLPALRAASEATLVASVVRASPAIEGAGKEASYWSAARDRLDADKTPPVSIVLIGGRGDFGETRYGAGFAWSFPVARRNQVEIARADAERDRALVQKDVALQAIEASVRGHLKALALARAALDAHDRTAIPAAQAVVDAARAAFAAGKGDLTRVFLARRDLAAARAKRLDLLASGWSAYAGLARLIGDLP